MLGNNSNIKHKLNSKLLLLAGVVFLVIILINLFNSWTNNQKINQEIDQLEQTAVGLKQKNLELSQLVQYLNSTAYIEEKARIDLGLKKEGEKTVVVHDLTSTDGLLANLNNSQEMTELSNFKKWWFYFFPKK